MINPDLERRFADCSELIEAWKFFLELVNRGTKNASSVTAQHEQQFLATKARIAMLHDSFMESLRHDKSVGANMLEIVKRSITLKNLRKLSEPEAKKLEQEWHEVFLLLNETVSTLNEDRAAILDVNETVFRAKRFAEYVFIWTKAQVTSIYFKLAAGLFGLIFVLWGVDAFGIYPYDNLRDVSAARPIVKLYLNVTRENMGMQMPYFDMLSFRDTFSAKATGTTVEADSSYNQQSAASLITNRLRWPDQSQSATEVRGLIDKSQGYDRLKVKEGEGPTGYVYLFWFRKSSDARTLHTKLTSATTPESFRILRKTNVVVVLQVDGSSGGPLMQKLESLMAKMI